MKTYTILTPDGARLAPVPESVLRTDLRDGRYPAGTVALAEGMDDWVPLEQLFPSTPTEKDEAEDAEKATRTPWRALCRNVRHWSFRGRARRHEYLMLLIAVAIICTLLSPLFLLLSDHLMGLGLDDMAAYLAPTLLPVLFLLPATARRLHDAGHSGWWLLLILAYPLGLIALACLLIQDSQYVNAWGPSAKYPN